MKRSVTSQHIIYDVRKLDYTEWSGHSLLERLWKQQLHVLFLKTENNAQRYVVLSLC